MLDKKTRELFLKGVFNEEDNKPEWALFWINNLIQNLENHEPNNYFSDEEAHRYILNDWFKEFWNHYQECKVFVEMVDEQESIDNLDLSKLNGS